MVLSSASLRCSPNHHSWTCLSPAEMYEDGAITLNKPERSITLKTTSILNCVSQPVVAFDTYNLTVTQNL